MDKAAAVESSFRRILAFLPYVCFDKNGPSRTSGTRNILSIRSFGLRHVLDAPYSYFGKPIKPILNQSRTIYRPASLAEAGGKR
jgi:hypothetical protein